MLYAIKSPVTGYSGVSAGVQFVNGDGRTDNPEIAEWFKHKGYAVTKNGQKEVKAPIKKPAKGGG